MNKKILIIAIIFILSSILFGAFGAHGLKQYVTGEKLLSFETGVRYQMYHGLALLIIGLNEDKFNARLRWFYNLIILGIVLFCFSIYFLVLQDVLSINLRFLGPITPLGGLTLIIGWSVLLIKLLKNK
jgi:uncharacterized membrane protein YgdD (TMEM256/DUF423 family)